MTDETSSLEAVDAPSRPGRRRALIIAGAVLGVLLLAVAVDAIASAGKIHPGVHVGTVAVGGMDRVQALAAVRSAGAKLLADPVNLMVDGETWSVEATAVGASADTTAAVDTAYVVGRDSDVLKAVGQRASAWFGKKHVPLDVSGQAETAAVFFDGVSKKVAQPGRDASVVIDGDQARLVPHTTGKDLDRDAVLTSILDAFASGRESVSAQLVDSDPQVSDEAAKVALADVDKMLDGQVTLAYESKKWQVTAATIGSWIAFKTLPATGTASAELTAYFADEKVSDGVTPLLGGIGKDAVDATFKVSGGNVSIVPSTDGLSLDATDLATTLRTRLVSGERTVEVKMQRVKPAISTDDAKDMGIKDRLSTFTTTFSAGNTSRVNNIRTLGTALNSTLVGPGKTFAFNETIGPRTAAKGYQEAPAIVNGELVPQLGGGICQVGTTIFNTVFFSGLPVVERHNHSEYISHYPTGRDATVSWGGPDFKFKNDTDHWILIAVAHTTSSITISMYGTDMGYKVAYTTGPWTNIKSPSTQTVKDPTLPVGAKVVQTSGQSGRTVVVSRTVTKSGSVVRKDTFTSVYKPSAEVVRVGTKVVTTKK